MKAGEFMPFFGEFVSFLGFLGAIIIIVCPNSYFQ